MAKFLTVGKWLKRLKSPLNELTFDEVINLEPEISDIIFKLQEQHEEAEGKSRGAILRYLNQWHKFYSEDFRNLIETKSEEEKKKFLSGNTLELLHSMLINKFKRKRKIGVKTYELKFSQGRPYYIISGSEGLSTLDDYKGPKGFGDLIDIITDDFDVMDFLVDNDISIIMEKIPTSDEHILVFSDDQNLKEQNKKIPIENFVKGLNFIGDEDDNQALSIVPADHNPADPFNVIKKIIENPTDVDSTKLFNATKQFPQITKVIKESLNKKLVTGDITLDNYGEAIAKLNESTFTPTTSDQIKYVKPIKRNPYKAKPGNVFN